MSATSLFISVLLSSLSARVRLHQLAPRYPSISCFDSSSCITPNGSVCFKGACKCKAGYFEDDKDVCRQMRCTHHADCGFAPHDNGTALMCLRGVCLCLTPIYNLADEGTNCLIGRRFWLIVLAVVFAFSSLFCGIPLCIVHFVRLRNDKRAAMCQKRKMAKSKSKSSKPKSSHSAGTHTTG